MLDAISGVVRWMLWLLSLDLERGSASKVGINLMWLVTLQK